MAVCKNCNSSVDRVLNCPVCGSAFCTNCGEVMLNSFAKGTVFGGGDSYYRCPVCRGKGRGGESTSNAGSAIIGGIAGAISASATAKANAKASLQAEKARIAEEKASRIAAEVAEKNAQIESIASSISQYTFSTNFDGTLQGIQQILDQVQIRIPHVTWLTILKRQRGNGEIDPVRTLWKVAEPKINQGLIKLKASPEGSDPQNTELFNHAQNQYETLKKDVFNIEIWKRRKFAAIGSLVGLVFFLGSFSPSFNLSFFLPGVVLLFGGIASIVFLFKLK